jgi:gas vesicle protein
MIVPLNFVVGAAVGAVATYVSKDEASKQWLSETGRKLKDGAGSFMASFKNKADDAAETIADKVDTAQESVAETAEEIQEKVAEPDTSKV